MSKKAKPTKVAPKEMPSGSRMTRPQLKFHDALGKRNSQVRATATTLSKVVTKPVTDGKDWARVERLADELDDITGELEELPDQKVHRSWYICKTLIRLARKNQPPEEAAEEQ